MPNISLTLHDWYKYQDCVEKGNIIDCPPIPFIPDPSQLNNKNVVEFMVKVNLAAKNDKSNTTKKMVWVFKGGTPDDMLQW